MPDVVSQSKNETLRNRIESAKPINVSHDFRRSLSSPFYRLIEIGSGRIHKFGQRARCPLLRIDGDDLAILRYANVYGRQQDPFGAETSVNDIARHIIRSDQLR